jgi:hypothetical protein
MGAGLAGDGIAVGVLPRFVLNLRRGRLAGGRIALVIHECVSW